MPVAKIFTRLTFFGFFYTIFITAFAQGSWQPAGADLSFPRTLLKTAEIPAVRQSLENPSRKELYNAVYAWAMVSPPATNSIATDRRMRARSAKNAAFIRLINLKPAASNTLDTLTAAEKAQLETNIILLLETINTTVDSPFSYENWQWRSKELIDYLTAYDLLRGAGVSAATLQISQTKLQEFSAKLYTEASRNIFGNVFLNGMKNNHLLMTASALGMAGVVLNDGGSATIAYQPQTWINAGMYAIDNVMWRDAQRQSEPGIIAGYAEGPYYFKYAMQNCLPFFRAFGNFLPDGNYSFTWNNVTRQIRNPYFDPNYDLLYEWAAEITMPDGRLPALEDSYIDMAMPELAITGKPQFVKNFYPQNLEPAQLKTLDAQLDGTVDLRANFLAANVNPLPETEKRLTSLPTSGNLIFRSGTGFQSNYLHVYGKNGKMLTSSGGHNHGDASSFSLYAYGQLLALDAGYIKYDRRTEVGNATNHNLVLVDGAGPLIGTSGAANDAEAFIQDAFETEKLTYGEVKTTYNGAGITRKTLNIRGEYYLMADFISAAAPHNFTWQLHGFGLENGTTAQGTFTDNATEHEGTWQKNGVSLKAHVTATNGASTYSKTTSIHETTYNQTENHTTFLVTKDNVSQTQFLATLQPYSTSAAATSTLSLTNLAGLVNTSPDFTDLAFTQADTVLQTVNTVELPLPVKSDANFSFFSVANTGEFAQLFLENGTTLFYGSEQIIQSNKRANISWAQLAQDEYQGYVSMPATLMVKVAKLPVVVTGQNLSSWNYDATTQTLKAIFSRPSDFSYRIARDPLPVELVSFQAEKVKDKVKLTWQTASEKNNKQFKVQRSTNAKNWESIATKSGQGTTTVTTNYELFDSPDFSGRIYYRLQQEDMDGSVHYSEVKMVTFEKPATVTLKLYPNPATEIITLELETDKAEAAEIKIMNLAGKEVYSNMQNISAGRNSIYCPLAILPAGFYLLTVQTQSKTQQTRFIKRLEKR
jgi:hypothetical protein